MFYTIYKTTNLINGKIYIGKHQTKNPNDDYLGSGIRLLRAVNKYGMENFKKEVLFIFDNEAEMNAKEAELVSEDFVKEDTNYNICFGGQGGFGYINRTPGIRNGFEHRPEINKELNVRAVLKVKHLRETDAEWRQSNYNAMSRGLSEYFSKNPGGFQGKTHTKEWRENHSNVMKERQSADKNSQFGTMWITNGVENRKIKKEEIIPEGWYKGRKLLRSRAVVSSSAS